MLKAGVQEQRMQHNYGKAIQNLNDILIDDNKFQEFANNIFLALDEDESGKLETHLVEKFVKDFMKGT